MHNISSELKVVPDNWVSIKRIWVTIHWSIDLQWLFVVVLQFFQLSVKLLRRRRKKKEEKIKQKEYYYLLKSNVSYFKSISLFIKFIYTCLCTLHVRLLSRTITIRNCTRMYVYVNLSTLFVFLDLYFYISILSRKKTSTCFRTLVLHLSLIILNVHLCVHVIFCIFYVYF